MATPLLASFAMGVVVLLPMGASGAQDAAASAPAQVRQAELPASSPAASDVPAATPAASAVPAAAPAASAVPPAAPPSSWVPNFPSLPFLDVINAPRDYLADRFVGLIGSIDRFFGNDRNYQETNDSVLQVDWTRVMGYTGEHKFVWQGKAKLHLPQAEKSLHLLLESDPDKNTANASNQVQAVQPTSNTTTPSSYGAGLRHELKSADERWFLGTDGGVKFAGLNTSPFLRARGSYSVPLELWRMKFAETLFWFNTTGVGETTQLDFERPISEPELFRATTSATWLNNRQSFDLRQDFALMQKLDERTAMLYQASAIGVSDARSQAHATDYVLLMLYRHRLHREWMYLEISPQLHFPQPRNFTASGMLSVRLEILFDKSR
jgi:hypothetical protein